MSDNWINAEYVANMTAQELRRELDHAGMQTVSVHAQDSGARIVIIFNDIRDAEALVSSAVPASTVPGTLYDRATGACVAITALVESGELTDESGSEATENAWQWNIHPHMVGRRADWHASVDMPHADAVQVAANLVALRWQA